MQTGAYVARNATIFKNNHKGDRAFGSILHRRPVRPDSRFLSRSLFTIFEINPIIILLAYTNSNTDIDTGKRKFNSYSRYLKISEQKWKRTWWLFPLYDSNSECIKISWKYEVGQVMMAVPTFRFKFKIFKILGKIMKSDKSWWLFRLFDSSSKFFEN